MIYCVEDDNNIQELIIYALKTTGYEACGLYDGKELDKKLKECLPKLILLDIMLPEKDGLTILKELKNATKTKDIPVILITAKGSEFDKVKGLDLGADDYITKPFGMMELLSRVKAVLRRCEHDKKLEQIKISAVTMNLEKRTVRVGETNLSLSYKEFELLKLMMENTNIVFTRDQLLSSVWGYDYDGESRTVDVHIRSLRQKLGDNSEIIKTIRNVGYTVNE